MHNIHRSSQGHANGNGHLPGPTGRPLSIVMFSINPLFPDRVMGGAPKQLQKVAVHLGELGHRVIVLCTRREDSAHPFRWHERVEVRPQLRFKQPFPEPYATPAFNLANAVADVADALATADRFYMHDGEFLFPYVYGHVPTVVSLRDNLYPETLLGGFLFQGDTLIAISDYSRRLYLSTMGRFFPELEERLAVIPNGVDWSFYRPVAPDPARHLAPDVDPAHHKIVLHPHRPEPSKGLLESIQVVELLVHGYGMSDVRLLAPMGLESALSPETRAYYDGIRSEIRQRGLDDHVIFHDWVPSHLMPAYYSLGDLTLSLGWFPESFGNTVYESLGCGTPALAARVSTHRELLPDHLLEKVHPGDLAQAAAKAAAILQRGERTGAETLAYLRRHYSVETQLAGYARSILQARPRAPMTYVYRPLTDETVYALPVWCYLRAGAIYHDFHACFRTMPELATLAAAHPHGFTVAHARRAGLDGATLEGWLRDGYIVPRPAHGLAHTADRRNGVALQAASVFPHGGAR